MYTNSNYNVLVGEYAKKHFIKSFEKKYKSVWKKTNETIFAMLGRIVIYSRTSKVKKIHICDNKYIAKCEFNIEGHNISTKASGNRIIVYVDDELFKVKILLLYAKTDVKGSNETQWWEKEISKNYPELNEIFSLL